MSIRDGLSNLGVAGPLAAEIQSQIAANTGDARRLRELGFIAGDILAAGITAGSVSAPRLAEASTPTVVARFLAEKINTPPVNTALPAITGTAQVGQTLNGSTGTWTSKTSITYVRAWLANGVVIAGATAATYVPVAGDVGKTITERVTATNANGSAVAVSAPTAAVIAA